MQFRFQERFGGRPAWVVKFGVFSRLAGAVLPAMVRLAAFRSKVGHKVFPWKVKNGDRCWIGDNVARLRDHDLRAQCVSQGAYLCDGTHETCYVSFPLVAYSTTLESEFWIAARAFVRPGARIGRRAVVGGWSMALSEVRPAMVVVPASRPDELMP
jgi:acetyltransferase-like isoleucine patch superfamily enzyme